MQKIIPTVWFWILVGLQILHSSEEYLTHLYEWAPIGTGKLHDLTGFFSIITLTSGTFALVNIGIIAVLILIGIGVVKQMRIARLAAAVVGIVEITNGILHITLSFILWRYFPGAVSAFGLLIVGAIVARIFIGRAPGDSSA